MQGTLTRFLPVERNLEGISVLKGSLDPAKFGKTESPITYAV